MKKLMFAAAVAAMTAGAFAGECAPVTEDVARVYQMQMNVYTTRGKLASVVNTAGSICTPGETTTEACTVFRGKDKTIIRGYIYTCSDVCELKEYEDCFADAKRKALFGSFDDDGPFPPDGGLEWTLLNFMGSKFTDVEVAWTFKGTVKYTWLGDEACQQYDLVGAGYGQLGSGASIFADKMSGNFAGTAGASYDTYNRNASTCACTPSSVLTCSGYGDLDYQQLDTVAFGSWKIKFNANDTKAYLKGTWNPITAIKKIMQ